MLVQVPSLTPRKIKAVQAPSLNRLFRSSAPCCTEILLAACGPSPINRPPVPHKNPDKGVIFRCGVYAHRLSQLCCGLFCSAPGRAPVPFVSFSVSSHDPSDQYQQATRLPGVVPQRLDADSPCHPHRPGRSQRRRQDNRFPPDHRPGRAGQG